MSFDELWVHVWEGNTNNDQTFKIAKSKYLSLQAKNKDFFQELFTSYSTTYLNEPEWGFPKGRRNMNEREIDCALREFEEETGINKHNIKLIENIIPYEEIFIASNYKTYKHKYFIAEVDDDIEYNLDNYQKAEVSKIKWFSLSDAIQIIRPYNSEKNTMLVNISNCLKYNTIM